MKRMRAECRGTYRVLLGGGIAFLAMASLFGALVLALPEEEPPDFLLPGAFFALALLCLGGYLLVTDPKWMLRRTRYGKALAALGDADELMAQIDQEALRMDYEAAMFALMPHWLVLYDSDPFSARWMGAVESLPIPRHQVKRLAFEKDSEEENSRYAVHVFLYSDFHLTVYAWERADIDALRAWGAVRETQDL